MKTEKFLMSVIFASIAGFAAMIISLLVGVIFFKESIALDIVGCIGGMISMFPFFSLQFFMPSGLLDRFGFEKKDIPFWGKAMIYLLVFPFANMWMLSCADALFHFLPDYHAAMTLGFDKSIVQAMRHESASLAWTIMSVAYVALITLGLVTRGIRQHFANKTKLA